MTPRRRSPLVLIFLTVFIDLIGFGIVIPVLPLYAERFGASPLVIGLLLGIYSLMQVICAPLLGKLSDRVGRRPVLLVSLIGTAGGFLLMGCARTLGVLFLARIIDGVTGGNLSTAQAYIADVTPHHERSRGMGLIGAAFGLGFIVGPAIGGVLSQVSWSAPFWFAGALAAANAVGVGVFLPESLPPERRHEARQQPSLREVMVAGQGGALVPLLATYFLATVAFSLLTATYPLFTERRFGYGAAQNGYIFAGQGVLAAVIQGALLGWLVRTAREKALVVAGTVVLGVGLVALPASERLFGLLLATAGTAVGHSLMAGPLNGLASQAVGPALQGRVLGVVQSTASLARIVGPVVGGWLLTSDLARQPNRFGTAAYCVGGAIMGLACWSALLIRDR